VQRCVAAKQILGVLQMANVVNVSGARNATRSVVVHSDQTTKKYGEVVRVEHDKVWGPQYLVAVPDRDMGEELFWMRRNEISFK
jgi:hypothetical protein